jgi:hypothetical protein
LFFFNKTEREENEKAEALEASSSGIIIGVTLLAVGVLLNDMMGCFCCEEDDDDGGSVDKRVAEEDEEVVLQATEAKHSMSEGHSDD